MIAEIVNTYVLVWPATQMNLWCTMFISYFSLASWNILFWLCEYYIPYKKYVSMNKIILIQRHLVKFTDTDSNQDWVCNVKCNGTFCLCGMYIM